MNPLSPNAPGQSGSPATLGRIIRRVEIWVAPYTKTVYELRWVQETFERNGVFVTDKHVEIDPNTDDGTIPTSRHQLRQCPCCYLAVTRIEVCTDCGLEFYNACTKEIRIDGETRRVCRRCAAKAT